MRAVCLSLPPSICLAGLSHPLSSSVSSGSVSQYQERSRSLKEMLMFCPPLWVLSCKEDDSAAACFHVLLRKTNEDKGTSFHRKETGIKDWTAQRVRDGK